MDIQDTINKLESQFQESKQYKELNDVLVDLDSKHKSYTETVTKYSNLKRSNRRRYNKTKEALENARNDYIVKQLANGKVQDENLNQDANSSNDDNSSIESVNIPHIDLNNGDNLPFGDQDNTNLNDKE